ncbi:MULTISPECIES: hypothetical protein [unclassified Bartonella]|uniref:hypothetical protein n=1 Tax=unclassified Bartonella TaxID=2645622 RepID=UPI0035CF4A10
MRGARWKQVGWMMQEGWGGYVCERVVHSGVLFWDTLLGHVLGCLCGRESAKEFAFH